MRMLWPFPILPRQSDSPALGAFQIQLGKVKDKNCVGGEVFYESFLEKLDLSPSAWISFFMLNFCCLSTCNSLKKYSDVSLAWANTSRRMAHVYNTTSNVNCLGTVRMANNQNFMTWLLQLCLPAGASRDPMGTAPPCITWAFLQFTAEW